MNQLLVFRKKVFFIISSIILIIICFSCFNSTLYVKMFYVNPKDNKLVYENREVKKESNKIKHLTAIIDDLLLGPVNPDFKNQFNSKSKLLAVVIEKNSVNLDFNRETFETIDDPAIIINSIMHTIRFNDKSIERAFFYVEGILFNYIGNYGPLDKGVISDNNYLSK
ncbi:MAG: hypothetical protein A2015_15565 [Spirochaetes bacterium GWF1_31_7]|nr:MAG: hypothetical protein A2Y30_01580 [Spirochaetes bacterium GWE1_32_154]OHD47040.1 MAG: hypothetical protein A2Y29_06475 [Spirochaetes bacterium GWE2_31_10]OHD53046.1 MAG: hypothetical protein A2015_15565 [Spirochaetes bacterium GWF1_31_7]